MSETNVNVLMNVEMCAVWV